MKPPSQGTKRKIDLDLNDYEVKFRITRDMQQTYKIKVEAPRFRGREMFLYDHLTDIANYIADAVKGKQDPTYIEIPFPQALLMLTPKIRHEKKPIPPDLKVVFFDDGELPPPDMMGMKYEIIDRETYGYKLPQAKMLDIIYPDRSNLVIKKNWLYDALAIGLAEAFTFNFYEALRMAGTPQIDPYYTLR